MKRKALLIAVFIFFLHYTTTFADVQAPVFSSKSIFITSSATPQIIYQNNADEKFSPGALVQIVPAIIALEKGDAEQIVEITADLAKVTTANDSVIGLKEGERFSIRQLIQAAIIGNSDDAANALALYISKGDLPAFIEMMNKRVAELGATNTHFTNATGNYHVDQYSTASDMALIYRKAYSMPTLQTTLKSKTVVLPATSFASERPMRTNNYVADNYLQTKYYNSYATGGKVGYYGTSVCNSVSFANKGGADVICVVMGGTKQGDNIMSLVDAKAALDFVYSNYKIDNTISIGDIIYDAKITGAKGTDKLNLIADDLLSVLVENNDTEGVKKEVVTDKKTFRAPITKGEILGEVKVSYKNVLISSIPLVASDNVQATAFGALGGLFAWIFSSWILKIAIILGVMWFGYKGLYLNPKNRREARKLERRRQAEERRKQG
ncbi:D-alanyl-D-alanine carboxypeptidase [Clostridia bacterium]|nr:D-alanyl-D-alanine carboxypeptidase [Clostridia bacterium]